MAETSSSLQERNLSQQTSKLQRLFSNILRKEDGVLKEDPSSAQLLLQAKPSSEYSMDWHSEELASGAEFTISAVHSSRSLAEEPLQQHRRYEPLPHRPAAPSRLQRTSGKGPAAQPPEVAAINHELQRMFRLQLGPLTLGSDIAPVLSLWASLQNARMAHGLKAVGQTWADLSEATAIVARKMTVEDITVVIDAQWRLAYPCPRSLRLPTTNMHVAIADRATAGRALRDATDGELLRYCAAVGRLLDAVSGVGGVSAAAGPMDVQQGLRAVERVAKVMPLQEAGMQEALRRAQLAAQQCAIAGDARPPVSTALLTADVLAELAGPRLAVPGTCFQRACLAASAEAEHAAASTPMQHSWWRSKLSLSSAQPKRTRSGRAPLSTAKHLHLPSHAVPCGRELLCLAEEVAECLARGLVPACLPAMTIQEMEKLARALKDATADDEGLSTHAPLRQCLGMVVGEAANRVGGAGGDFMTKSCVRAVISACRQRLLHCKFPLSSPERGIPGALASLEGWKVRAKKAPIAAAIAQQSRSEEATSLELEGNNDAGEEASSAWTS